MELWRAPPLSNRHLLKLSPRSCRLRLSLLSSYPVFRSQPLSQQPPPSFLSDAAGPGDLVQASQRSADRLPAAPAASPPTPLPARPDRLAGAPGPRSRRSLQPGRPAQDFLVEVPQRSGGLYRCLPHRRALRPPAGGARRPRVGHRPGKLLLRGGPFEARLMDLLRSCSPSSFRHPWSCLPFG